MYYLAKYEHIIIITIIIIEKKTWFCLFVCFLLKLNKFTRINIWEHSWKHFFLEILIFK